MFRTLRRKFLANQFDQMLHRCAKRGGKRVLIHWNRGLGDIALGLYAMVERARELVPGAEVTFLTRENLVDGFSMLEGVKVVGAPWKRGEKGSIPLDSSQYDLVIEKPDPSEWVRWQRGKLTPQLQWNSAHDALWEKFDLPAGYTYIGVQVAAETPYALWRNWPLEHWRELFARLDQLGGYKVLLFGFGAEPVFSHECAIDLRGKTNLFELLSIIKNRCHHLILPDSGILSFSYYLDATFPLHILSLWADPNHGILKQNVSSPNKQLQHTPLIAEKRDLRGCSVMNFASLFWIILAAFRLKKRGQYLERYCPRFFSRKAAQKNQKTDAKFITEHPLRGISVNAVLDHIAPTSPLRSCLSVSDIVPVSLQNIGAIILAGGLGTRLGAKGPKGTFVVRGKSLFEWIVEKASAGPVAVMTSESNHEETVAFFREKGNFGKEVYFFSQGKADGNGSVYEAFERAGLGKLFEEKKCDVVLVVPVENVLADLADAALVTHHRATKADVTIKCVPRLHLAESMGVLVERQGRIEILEYLHLKPETYHYNYTGMLALNLSFMRRMAVTPLPFHPVQKKGVWKQERFLFDAFVYANRVSALCYPRQMCYAPLKSLDQLEEIERRVV